VWTRCIMHLWVSLEMPHTYLNILFEIHFFEIISHSCLYLVHYPHSSRWHSFWRMHFYFSFTLFDLLLFLHSISCFFYVFWVCMKIFFENSMNEVDLGWSFHMLILCLSIGIKAIHSHGFLSLALYLTYYTPLYLKQITTST
jgi:hypothetical protein